MHETDPAPSDLEARMLRLRVQQRIGEQVEELLLAHIHAALTRCRQPASIRSPSWLCRLISRCPFSHPQSTPLDAHQASGKLHVNKTTRPPCPWPVELILMIPLGRYSWQPCFPYYTKLSR